MDPFPVPPVFPVIEIQLAPLLALQAQLLPVVTTMFPELPEASADAVRGSTAYAQVVADCVRLTAMPAIVRLADRPVVPGFEATL
jgi:hypothetical protein